MKPREYETTDDQRCEDTDAKDYLKASAYNGLIYEPLRDNPIDIGETKQRRGGD
jgi:hypothetical protein